MQKLFVGCLILSLIFVPEMAVAGKSYSSSRSSSSSSRSSGRSYSSGSGSRSSSSSSRPSSSGSSFFGGSSRSSSSGSSKPSSSGSFFGGSSSSGSKPSSSGSGKNYSSSNSGSKPYTPSYTPPPVTGSSGKSYSSSNSSSSPASSPPKGKPTSSTFNSSLATSAKNEQSRVRYQAANEPKSTYKTPTGQVKEIKSTSPQVRTVRNYVTHERYVTYDNRSSSFYGGYYSHPVYYNDSFSPFLWGWIMSDTLNSHQRALWMYHHQNDMDQARWDAMMAKDARLQAEINSLKAQNLVQDGSYVPEQMKDNPDVMYNKEFVDASYNPEVVSENQPSSFWSAFKTLFWWCFWLSVIGAVIYYGFVKEY